jgi:hypothetical protein
LRRKAFYLFQSLWGDKTQKIIRKKKEIALENFIFLKINKNIKIKLKKYLLLQIKINLI